ncbi:metallophosphoesterase family protein [Thiomicrospira microaerophila]|uniref:metallophosphoesterase family protein n=1 Tax=Thiomicrospira microaerophila TaxID=406020 RepID=UPI0006987DDC|nr:metallophosphoesterase [Thiomicrospira microaerophila]
MNILHISDTHGQHGLLDFAGMNIDVLIHSGDFSESGSQKEVLQFFDWFAHLPIVHKILVPGNHDYFVEEIVADPQYRQYFWPNDFHLLIGEGVEIEGVRFWGSPVTPWFFEGAFNQERDQIANEWAKIPADTQVLITHGPRFGVLDRVEGGTHEGCHALRTHIADEMPDLKVHLHGHIHSDHGAHRAAGLLTLNSAMMDRHYKPSQLPQWIERHGACFVTPQERAILKKGDDQAWLYAVDHKLVDLMD